GGADPTAPRPRPLHFFLRDPDHLGDGGRSLSHAPPAVLAKRPHALLRRRLLDDAGRRALEDEPLHLVGYRKELEDAGTPAVARARTALAAAADDGPRGIAVTAADLPPQLGRHLGRLHAAAADATHEALRQNAEQRRREQIAFDVHLEQSRHGAGG